MCSDEVATFATEEYTLNLFQLVSKMTGQEHPEPARKCCRRRGKRDVDFVDVVGKCVCDHVAFHVVASECRATVVGKPKIFWCDVESCSQDINP